MPFTADELSNISASALENYLNKGTVFKQNIANKPMLAAFDGSAGSFSGGKEYVSVAVAAGQGGGSLQGYTGDDQVSYYNPASTKRAKYPWKEHHIGIGVTHTELKTDGIDVVERGTDQDTREMSGREDHALANMLDEKLEALGEDYAFSLDRLIHGDGSTDAKALAGIKSLVLDVPTTGSTGTLGRSANSWWRNRAATASFGSAGGQGAIASNTANGGALIEFLEKEWLQLGKYRKGSTNVRIFAGSDFRAAYMKEIRANGYYSQTGFQGKGNVDGGMDEPYFKGKKIEYDPTLDDLGLAKRAYFLDISKRGITLLYMDGQKMKKHNPARPYDRYVMFQGITMTGVMIARQLNTSAVYDIQ